MPPRFNLARTVALTPTAAQTLSTVAHEMSGCIRYLGTCAAENSRGTALHQVCNLGSKYGTRMQQCGRLRSKSDYLSPRSVCKNVLRRTLLIGTRAVLTRGTQSGAASPLDAASTGGCLRPTMRLARKLHRFAKRGRGDGQTAACFASSLRFRKANASPGAQAYLTVRRAPQSTPMPRSTRRKIKRLRSKRWVSQIRVRSRESVNFSG